MENILKFKDKLLQRFNDLKNWKITNNGDLQYNNSRVIIHIRPCLIKCWDKFSIDISSDEEYSNSVIKIDSDICHKLDIRSNLSKFINDITDYSLNAKIKTVDWKIKNILDDI